MATGGDSPGDTRRRGYLCDDSDWLRQLRLTPAGRASLVLAGVGSSQGLS